MATHTILLWQPLKNDKSRTWKDFQSISAAMDYLCSMFETRLQEMNPAMRDITYDVNDLYAYIDSLPDLCALVFSGAINAYEPRAKDWVKQEAYTHLGRQVGGAAARRGGRR